MNKKNSSKQRNEEEKDMKKSQTQRNQEQKEPTTKK